MKKLVDNGVAHAAHEQHVDLRPLHEQTTAEMAAQLQRSYVALTELREALFEKSAAAQKEVVELMQENTRLKQDLMDLAQKEALAKHFAHHDELTGLPNRRLLLDRLNQAISHAARHNKWIVLMFFDVEGFKHINDQLGHDAGDKLLREVAQRLQFGVRGADTVSRYGGDEFLIMLPGVESDEHSAVEQKLRTRLARPYSVGGRTLSVKVSVGCATYPVDGKTDRELIQKADVAMYQEKTNGAKVDNQLLR